MDNDGLNDRFKIIPIILLFSLIAALSSSHVGATLWLRSSEERFIGNAIIDFHVVERVEGHCWKIETAQGKLFELSFESDSSDFKGRRFIAVLPRRLAVCHAVDFDEHLVFEILDDGKLLESCHDVGRAFLDFKKVTGSRFPGAREPGECRSWIRFDFEEARRAIREYWMFANREAVAGAESLPEMTQETRR